MRLDRTGLARARSGRWSTANRLRPARSSLWVLVVAQIALGSWLRHYGIGQRWWRTGSWRWRSGPTLLFFSAGSSGAVRLSPLVPVGAGGGRCASTLQIVLGIVAMVYLLPFDGIPRPVTFYQAVVRTGHQTNGALLLAATVVLDTADLSSSGSARRRAGRLIRHEVRTRPLEPAAMDWEAVA